MSRSITVRERSSIFDGFFLAGKYMSIADEKESNGRITEMTRLASASKQQTAASGKELST
jgi:hypothetical protein